MFGFIFYEKMGANRKVVYGGVVAKLQLLLWFVNDNKKSIFLVTYWCFMCYNTLRRTMLMHRRNLLESHLESMILVNDSKMILFFRKAQEIQGASWNIKK